MCCLVFPWHVYCFTRLELLPLKLDEFKGSMGRFGPEAAGWIAVPNS